MKENASAFRIALLALSFVFVAGPGWAQPQSTLPSAQELALGRHVYDQNCAICHGQDGAGNGPAARFVNPKPRDFTKGIFKFRSTADLPTDDDLLRTITRGVPGSLMPSFEYLPPEDRRAVVGYVKSLSNAFRGPSPKPVTLPEPPPESPSLLEKGAKLYVKLACTACHGSEGRGDGPAAASLADSWGNSIQPYNFTNPLEMMPGGSSVEDIYRTLKYGIGGTPMPSLAAMPDEGLWAEAYYVRSLAQGPPTPVATGDSRIGKELFIGSRRLENGGPPCIGCHSVAGIGALGGGAMGPDLTVAFRKFGPEGTAAILATVPFPVMNPLFSNHPLVPDEQADLTGFLQSVGVVQRPAGAAVRLVLSAAILAAILLLLSALVWRRRLTKVRSAMVGKS